MLVSTKEHPVRVIAEDSSLDCCWKASSFREVGGIDRMEVVASIKSSWCVAWAELAILKLRSIGLRGHIPQARRRINDTSRCDANRWGDVVAIPEIRSQEWYVEVS